MASREEEFAEVEVSTRRISTVWLVPLVAILIGAWLIYDTLSKQGPKVTITFQTADGIEEGKTKLKLKEVDIGVVESVQVKEDLSGVVITASLAPHVKSFLTKTTRFWVVRPRLGAKGISGLGTLVSGAFIEVDPGKGGEARRDFIGLETPPVVKADTPGREYLLKAKRLGSLSNGSPVYYRGIEVGEVLGHDLSDDNREVLVHIFVHAPHHELIHDNTRFWNVSGLQVSVGAGGIKVRTGTLQTLVLGGIAFETPDSLSAGTASAEGKSFPLYATEKDIAEARITQKFPWVMNFEGSVRGLSPGAPVEFKGIRVGTVKDVRLEVDRETLESRIPVLVEIEPERITVAGSGQTNRAPSYEEHKKSVEMLIASGLRARLKTGSLITGQLVVDMDMYPETELKLVGVDDRYPEIPTIPSSIEEITGSITTVLNKIEKLPLKELTDSLVRTVEGIEKAVNSPEIKQTVRSLDETMQSLNRLASNMDKDLAPQASKALGEAHKALKAVREAVADNSPLRYDLETMLRELADASRSIRLLAEYLESNPNALIYGKGPQGGK